MKTLMEQYNPLTCCHVGIRSLEEVVTRDTRVCIMNILGNESRKVSPVSHAYSGGNIVAGVQYGRSAVLPTPAGDIPVYSRLADVMDVHTFDTGVIYLPPEAVYNGVTELCHYNKQLKKIIIITEKVSVKDQRLIRAICQANHIDLFGANCLGVADAWQHVRVGGALGGDHPEETLKKGSVAIHSNSGNFSTTIAEYLKTQGFGVTTVISSGKDVIIQFAVAEFLFAAQNDPRTKAVALYVEPGGYYEKQALDLIENGALPFDKPMVVCVTGRWKSNLSRACGHAGALAGSGDDAASKEAWFDAYFGVPAFDPEQPRRVSKRGVRVASIQHIPLAMKAVYEVTGMSCDFEPSGSLGLKPWFINNFGRTLPLSLRLDVHTAPEPYAARIEEVNRALGATLIRQNMRNASGASRIDTSTYVAALHNVPVVDLADFSYEENIFFSLSARHPEKELLPVLNMCLNYLSIPGNAALQTARSARRAGATPNQVLAGALACVGDNRERHVARRYMSGLIDIMGALALRDLHHYDKAAGLKKALRETFTFTQAPAASDAFPSLLMKAIRSLPEPGVLLKCVADVLEEGYPEHAEWFLIAAVALHAVYPSLALKQMARQTAEDLPGYLSVVAQTLWLSVPQPEERPLFKALSAREDTAILSRSFTEIAYEALFNHAPDAIGLREFNALLALTLTNGPGTLSAKGAKESVSARNHISTAFMGFLTNTGLSHGGSGYEAVQYLLESFKGREPEDPADISRPGAIRELARERALAFKEYKEAEKLRGATRYKRIPCINHPVFKGKRVNTDPREAYIRKHLREAGVTNVFWEFYHALVEALYDVGATSNVYCVNIDAVIAVISLKLMWKPWREGRMKEQDMQDIGFLVFLLGRTAGIAAEIADHRSRGQDMDCRTPLKETRYVV